MEFLKKNVLNICLCMLVLFSLSICVYSISNYKGSNNLMGGEKSQANFANRTFQGNMPNHQFNNNNSSTNNRNSFNSNTTNSKNNFMKMGSESSGSKYESLIVAYSMLFFGGLLITYYISKKRKIKVNIKNPKFVLFAILFSSFLLRIFVSIKIQGFSSDLGLFKNWAVTAANNFSDFYSNARSGDYPPFYIYILFVIGKILSISAMSKYSIIFLKLPSILADIATAFIMYNIAKKYMSNEISILVSAFYVLNPAIFINSTLWGQVDSFFTLLVTSAVFLLSENKMGFSTILFTLAVLMKPQGIIFLPVLFFELVRQKKLKSVIKVLSVALATFVIVILPFFSFNDPLWIFRLYSSTVGEYPYASVNAFNFFSLIGANFTSDKSTFLIFSYHTWGMIFIVLITLFSWWSYIKVKNKKFASVVALIQIAGVFTFSVGMHERYLFPAAALAVLAYIYLKDKRFLLISLGFSITSYVNTHIILFRNLKGVNSNAFGDSLLYMAILNIILFAYLVKIAFHMAKGKIKTETNNDFMIE